ncbi:hypothetical protein [Pseudomonas sp. RIT-PI-AD]|uniref:hypothetical protein n=1 Tax=Pseudomonas sp. RIT-PI-AD TaxID=3035294 RepID=UPI0021D9DBA5|nr:hypothetical protein [Pseudomonas sp. RIT-PI-AD]
MNNPLFYACSYVIFSVVAFSAGRLAFDDADYGIICAFTCGLIFSVIWNPTIIGIIASEIIYSIAFNLDMHRHWYWLSEPKSEEMGDLTLIAGLGIILPLIISWIGFGFWKAFRKSSKSR